MRKKKGTRVMAAALCLTAVFGFLFGGCRKKPEDPDPEPIDGGTTLLKDPDAPKTIESKDIAAFSASLTLFNRWRGDEIHEFSFEIASDASGTLTASEKGAGISLPADRELLEALQKIIDEYDLVSKNGLTDVTAGLPPEFGAVPFKVLYASGEVLSFTVNNSPESPWGEAIYDLFAEWFAENGENSLRPDTDESVLTRVRFEYAENGREVSFSGVNVQEKDAIDGETHLLSKSVRTGEDPSASADEYRLFPEDYYEKVTAIIAATDLQRNYAFSYYDLEARDMGNHDRGYYGMGTMTTADGEPDSDDLSLDLYLEFESGRRLNVETRKASEIEGMRSLIDALTEYHDSLFD